jgi:hypothetical protein
MNTANNSLFDEGPSEPLQKRKRTEGSQADNVASSESGEDIAISDRPSPAVHDPEYYLEGDGADCVILVENTLFKVHAQLYVWQRSLCAHQPP